MGILSKVRTGFHTNPSLNQITISISLSSRWKSKLINISSIGYPLFNICLLPLYTIGGQGCNKIHYYIYIGLKMLTGEWKTPYTIQQVRHIQVYNIQGIYRQSRLHYCITEHYGLGLCSFIISSLSYSHIMFFEFRIKVGDALEKSGTQFWHIKYWDLFSEVAFFVFFIYNFLNC